MPKFTTQAVAERDDLAWIEFAKSALAALIPIASRQSGIIPDMHISTAAADYADAMMIEREKRLPVYLRTNIVGE